VPTPKDIDKVRNLFDRAYKSTKCFAHPKSQTKYSPEALIRMLSGLRSKCIISSFERSIKA